MTRITLIDAYGSDHGLRVEVDTYSHTVSIAQWSECCEPDENGSYAPHIQTSEMDLAECLEHARDGRHHPSQSSRVIQGALNYLAYHGGDADYEYLDDDDHPRRHFLECVDGSDERGSE